MKGTHKLQCVCFAWFVLSLRTCFPCVVPSGLEVENAQHQQRVLRQTSDWMTISHVQKPKSDGINVAKPVLVPAQKKTGRSTKTTIRTTSTQEKRNKAYCFPVTTLLVRREAHSYDQLLLAGANVLPLCEGLSPTIIKSLRALGCSFCGFGVGPVPRTAACRGKLRLASRTSYHMLPKHSWFLLVSVDMLQIFKPIYLTLGSILNFASEVSLK